jgi:hypothetical protein
LLLEEEQVQVMVVEELEVIEQLFQVQVAMLVLFLLLLQLFQLQLVVEEVVLHLDQIQYFQLLPLLVVALEEHKILVLHKEDLVDLVEEELYVVSLDLVIQICQVSLVMVIRRL